ncbi:hypothetical protein FVE85_1318 [Porphyridium purpureum]|uniref:Translocation and assembly module TamB C-terminal domain-containing protein n=1 Tax=Porphyridium purpureum TaxID=35688 RepID=A0A5J4YHE3_PORPP|nr:hypothetical protein FVE85_1318 [Porphyridium purpureum]|eukprot:POR8895..scf251_18
MIQNVSSAAMTHSNALRTGRIRRFLISSPGVSIDGLRTVSYGKKKGVLGRRERRTSGDRDEAAQFGPDLDIETVNLHFSNVLRGILYHESIPYRILCRGGELHVKQSSHGPSFPWVHGVNPSVRVGKRSSLSSLVGDSSRRKTFSSWVRQLRFDPQIFEWSDSRLVLHPADLVVFGHGSEEQIIDKFRVSLSRTAHQVFRIEAHGSTGGGSGKDSESRLRFGTTVCLPDLLTAVQEKDTSRPVLTGVFSSTRLPARIIAAALNLPFRVEQGSLTGNLELQFMRHSATPLVSGRASFEGLMLRFAEEHESAPVLERMCGAFVFKRRQVHFDSVTGSFGRGRIPFRMGGSIDFTPESGFYALQGDTDAAHAGRILDVFQTEKFPYVRGLFSTRMKMYGVLEEPKISGALVSVPPQGTQEKDGAPDDCGVVFDKIELKHAYAHFAWDAEARKVIFTDMRAVLKHNPRNRSEIRGQGGIYFGPEKKVARKRSGRSRRTLPPVRPGIPPLPKDPLEIDPYAPERLHDSVRFDFNVERISSAYVLNKYGGKYGEWAQQLAGEMDADIVVAGPAKAPIGKISWRTVGKSPRLATDKATSPLVHEDTAAHGVAYAALGDPLTARRVRMQTWIDRVDGRRFLWDNLQIRDDILSRLPVIEGASRFDFVGTVTQRPLFVSAEELLREGLHRSPPVKLQAIDGHVCVYALEVNGLDFRREMRGAVRLREDFFGLDVMEETQRQTRMKALKPNSVDSEAFQSADILEDPNLHALTLAFRENESALIGFQVPGDPADARTLQLQPPQQEQQQQPGDEEAQVPMAAFGRAGPTPARYFRCSANAPQRAFKLDVRNMTVESVLGKQSGLRGDVTVTAELDGRKRSGEASLRLLKPCVEHVQVMEEISGDFLWAGDRLLLQNSKLEQKRSEYHVEGSYHLNSGASDFKVVVPRGDLRDWADILMSRDKRQSKILRTKVNRYDKTRDAGHVSDKGASEGNGERAMAGEEDDIRSAPGVGGGSDMSKVDEMTNGTSPANLPATRTSSQIQGTEARNSKASLNGLGPQWYDDLRGEFSGIVQADCQDFRRLRLFSLLTELQRSGNGLSMPSFMNLKRRLDAAQFNCSVEMNGFDVAVWENVQLGSGKLGMQWQNGVLSLNPSNLNGPKGLSAFASGQIDTNAADGSMALNFSSRVTQIPAEWLEHFVPETSLEVRGALSLHTEVHGTALKPLLDARLYWENGWIDGKRVRGFENSFIMNGKGVFVDFFAQIGRRSPRTRKEMLARQRLFAQIAPTAAFRTELERETEYGPLAGEPICIRFATNKQYSLTELLGLQPRRLVESVLMKMDKEEDAAQASTSNAAKAEGEQEPQSVQLHVDAQRCGTILLNAVLPSSNWLLGESDVFARVQGPLHNPRVFGFVSMEEGIAWPNVVQEPLENVRGDVFVYQDNVLDIRGLEARCGGRRVSADGLIPLFDSGLEFSSNWPATRSRRRAGLTLECGDLAVQMPKLYSGNVKGRLTLARSLSRPSVGGRVHLSEGVLYLSKPLPEMGDVDDPSNSMLTSDRIDADASTSGLKSTATTMRVETDGTAVFSNPGMSLDRSPRDLSQQSGDKDPTRIAADSEEHVPTTRERIQSAAEYVSSQSALFDMADLELSLRKNFKIEYPNVLSFEARGSLRMNGSTVDPKPQGKVTFPAGTINTLTSSFRLVRGSKHSATFTAGKDVLDPLVSMALEDQFMVARVKSVRATQALKSIDVYDKSGRRIGGVSEVLSRFVDELATHLMASDQNPSDHHHHIEASQAQPLLAARPQHQPSELDESKSDVTRMTEGSSFSARHEQLMLLDLIASLKVLFSRAAAANVSVNLPVQLSNAMTIRIFPVARRLVADSSAVLTPRGTSARAADVRLGAGVEFDFGKVTASVSSVSTPQQRVNLEYCVTLKPVEHVRTEFRASRERSFMNVGMGFRGTNPFQFCLRLLRKLVGVPPRPEHRRRWPQGSRRVKPHGLVIFGPEKDQ